MHTKESLMRDLKRLGINPRGTLLVHSSYKSIGDVEGRADTVPVSYTHLDVYKRQVMPCSSTIAGTSTSSFFDIFFFFGGISFTCHL